MKFYHITESPLKIYGLAVADREKRQFWKLPAEALEKFPGYSYLGRRTAGGRVRFATNSENITIRMTLAETKEDINIPLSGSAGADVYVGTGRDSEFIGYIAPGEHQKEEISVEKSFRKKAEMQVVTVNLPRNDHLLSMEIGVDEGADIKEAPAYRLEKPMVFYGSSITEGGCASRAGNAYTSIVSRWLDANYINLGFSGSARGELDFAEYITTLEDMSVFIYDYDHNSPSPEHLAETHEPFFKLIREKFPTLPILMISKPDTDKNPKDSEKRVEVIRRTYENAKAAGDDRVWFIDGRTHFGETGRSECTVDGTHPNALGFMRMAENVYPVLEEILNTCILL